MSADAETGGNHFCSINVNDRLRSVGNSRFQSPRPGVVGKLLDLYMGGVTEVFSSIK